MDTYRRSVLVNVCTHALVAVDVHVSDLLKMEQGLGIKLVSGDPQDGYFFFMHLKNNKNC